MADPAQATASPGPGGFFQPSTGLMSPSPSLASSARSTSSILGLPHPRRQPLRPGSAKEDLVRRYVSDRLLQISRRFVKKYGIAEPGDTVIGYKSMGELCRDVDTLLNNLWKSGTPSLQVQYLLNIASELITWMDGFAPSPRATLAILRKLDYCFASLLIGEDFDTHEVLPGFETGGSTSNRRVGLSRTDMVRCRSIAEQSRIAVVDVFRRGPPDPLDENDPLSRPRNNNTRRSEREGTVGTEASTLQGDDTEDGRETTAEPTDDDATTLADETEEDIDDYPNDDYDDDDIAGDTQMGVARVYENTLVKLGEVLGDQPGRIGDFEPQSMDLDNSLEDENDDEY
ncbi:hypothetical protein SBRCBS47491_000207 [Sporothrix bragantina]|uniref:Meiotic recombination protein DMC1 n=1 Tax=Sporothrix bragantina TaxID=671064 RepID=A0ABP0ANF7_9PEZI